MALSNRDTMQELRALQALGGQQPNALNFIMNLQTLVIILAGWTSISVEVFIRYSFGERYFNFLRVLLGYLTFRFFGSIIWLLAGLPAAFKPDAIDAPLPGMMIANFSQLYWIFAIAQLLLIGYRNRTGTVWHSESFGRSIFSFMLPAFMPISRLVFGNSNPEFIFYRAVEPAIVIIIGVLFTTAVDRVMGIWIIFAGVALIIRNNLVFNAARNRVLDRQDAMIESQAYQRMQDQQREKKGKLNYGDMNVAGFSVIPMKPVDLQLEIAEREAARSVEEVVAETMGEATYPPSQAQPGG